MCKDIWRRLVLGGFAAFAATALTLNAQAAVAADALKRFKPVFDAEGQLIVAAVVVAEPPYQADTTGKSDTSAVIQREMGDVLRPRWRNAFLPAGRYPFDKHITVPATVTLCGRGESRSPTLPLSGTVLFAYANKYDATGPALLSPPECGHANVFNLSIYYPEQNPLRARHPFSIDGRVALRPQHHLGQ